MLVKIMDLNGTSVSDRNETFAAEVVRSPIGSIMDSVQVHQEKGHQLI